MSTTVRGRPKSLEKKKRIFEAAVDLFLSNGFDNTSMDQIAEQAGVSKQTVYSHFKNKEELFSACVCEKCVAHQLTAEFLDRDRPCAQMLHELGHRFNQLLLSPEAIGVKRLLCATAEQQPRLSEVFFEAGPGNMIAVLADYLKDQSMRGRLKVEDPRMAACQFLYMIHGEAQMRLLLNVPGKLDRKKIDSYVDSCVRVFLRAHAV